MTLRKNILSRARDLRASTRWFSSSKNESNHNRRLGANVMQAEGYRDNSHCHYDVHTLSRDMLLSSAARVVSSSSSWPLTSAVGDDGGDRGRDRPLRLVDLGVADGTSSIKTLQVLVESIQKPMHVTLEEHPNTDERVLRDVLNSHQQWFQEKNIQYDVLLKSFYEPLFEKNSIDMFVSYICLHWLDTTDCTDDGTITSWKKVGDEKSNLEFVFAQEEGVSESVRQYWKSQLALPHLVQFLTTRAQELRVGGEMVLVMVADPYAWVSLPKGSIFTQAIQRCIQRNEVRPCVLQNVVVPYYLRSLEDVEDAITVSNVQLKNESIQIELLDTRMMPLDVGKDDMDSAFDLFWSVHQAAIRAGGATEEEMRSIRKESKIVNEECFSPATGIETIYMATVIRRSC